jgi:hypothetical protein
MILKPRISGDISYKRRWEYFAAVAGIGLGYLVYFIITFIIPNYSSGFVYEALPSFLVGIFETINDTSVNNVYFPLLTVFIAFIEFPSCLVWILPGIMIGYYRNKQFMNIDVKNTGWKTYWHAILLIEVAFLIFSVGLFTIFLTQFIPGAQTNEILLSFFGSGIARLLMIFLSPFFWMGLGLAGLGGFIGTKIAVNKYTVTEVVVEEVEAEEIFMEEKMIGEEMFEGEAMWPEEAVTGESDVAIADIQSLKEKMKATADVAASATADTIKCSKCGKTLPAQAKFCNNCGNKLV